MSKRVLILTTAVFCMFVLAIVRLADLMLLKHDNLTRIAQSQQKGKKSLHKGRGKIFDRRGRELAVNLDVMSAYCNPRQIDRPGETAAVLAKATGTDYSKLLVKLSSDKGFVWLDRKIDSQKAGELQSLKIKGLGLMQDIKRYYPKGNLASHVLGFVGMDNQPLEGIELKYDSKLKGKEQNITVQRDARGRTLSEGLEFEQGGNSIVLTIDEGLQYILETELDAAMQKWQPASASAVMMDPFTGEILALSNRPTYDLNSPMDSSSDSRRNRAITDTYEPGSIFKAITASAALEEGVVTPYTTVDCNPGRITIGRKTISDVHKKGVLTFREVIQHSSNVGTVKVALMLGKENLHEYAKRFGFGDKCGVDLNGECGGRLLPVKKWSQTSLAAMSIGYGVAVTPLQIVRAYSAIANGGRLLKPYLVSDIISPDGQAVFKHEQEEPKPVISKATADTLKEILVSVTDEGGTAKGASVEGNRVAGKTGTARLYDSEKGQYSMHKYSSSFVGFVPADNPKIALVVVLFEPKGAYYGGTVSAPVFKGIADKTLSYLEVPREDDFKDNTLVVKASTMRQ